VVRSSQRLVCAIRASLAWLAMSCALGMVYVRVADAYAQVDGRERCASMLRVQEARVLMARLAADMVHAMQPLGSASASQAGKDRHAPCWTVLAEDAVAVGYARLVLGIRWMRRTRTACACSAMQVGVGRAASKRA
jgi:hypothetical protein